MPKQIWKIDQFHGGLNSNSDPRDIAPSELSAATDIMVDEVGKIRTMGGTAAHGEIPANPSTTGTGIANPSTRITVDTTGFGLFQFSHDRMGAATAGAAQPERGDDYLVLSLGGQGYNNFDIYSRDSDAWSENAFYDYNSNLADLDGDGSADGGEYRAVFYFADGALRVSTSLFGPINGTVQDFTPMWYGYIKRYFLGDGVSGYTGNGFSNGYLIDRWISDIAAPEALNLAGIEGENNNTNPVPSGSFIKLMVSGKANYHGLTPGVGVESIAGQVDFSATSPNVEAVSPYLTPGYANFCSVGDKILIYRAEDVGNNRIFTVSAVSSNDTSPNTIDFEEAVTAHSDDIVYMHNLSRSDLFDPINPGFEFALSTLYDDVKQESALAKYKRTGINTGTSATVMTNSGGAIGSTDDFIGWRIKNITDGSSGIITVDDGAGNITVDDLTGGDDDSWDPDDEWEISIMTPIAICGTEDKGFQKINLRFRPYTGTAGSIGITSLNPRVSGFRIYMRRENTSNWYFQSEVDVTKGHKTAGTDDYNMWFEVSIAYAEADSGYFEELRQIETYESMTGYSSSLPAVGISGEDTGWKTAVVANRIAYLGHVRCKDEKGVLKTYGDAVLKSDVGKFDSFSIERRLETDIRDGDEIVKLEEYADRLLIFKKKKMQLLNISQEIEFLEETFMYKGISHQVSACKTDFGIAWVNNLGCYLYDGQKVTNLLEKGGRQIIKESEWSDFIGAASSSAVDNNVGPMIGYLPKKRQLIVVDDVGSNRNGHIFLYDMVTQSWVKGLNDSSTRYFDIYKTNFVTDWNGDLMFMHSTSGTVLKWDDASDTTDTIDIKTKDIDFGQPGQRKKVYRVYVTYKCTGNTYVRVQFGVDGETSLTKDFTTSSVNFGGDQVLDDTSGEWDVAELVPDDSSEVSSIKSFQLWFWNNGATPADFEINDISIVYRLKPVK